MDLHATPSALNAKALYLVVAYTLVSFGLAAPNYRTLSQDLKQSILKVPDKTIKRAENPSPAKVQGKERDAQRDSNTGIAGDRQDLKASGYSFVFRLQILKKMRV